MIMINLQPEELKKKDIRFKKTDIGRIELKDIPLVKIAGGFLGALLILNIALFLIGIYGKASYGSLSKKYNKILPQEKEAESLKAQVDMINRKVGAIDELMVKRFKWARKLNDLSDSMTSGIWLTGLSYDEKIAERAGSQGEQKQGLKAGGQAAERVMERYLMLSGYASSMGDEGTALIGKFIKSLKDSASFYSDFNTIELGAIKRDKIEDQEVMTFTITCLFKETK